MTTRGGTLRTRTLLLAAGVVATAVFCLVPFYWLINISLRAGSDLSSGGLFPTEPTLRNYTFLLKDRDFLLSLRNSLLVASATTVLALMAGACAAYAIARLVFPARRLLLLLVLSVSTFPGIAIAAPLFKLWSDVGLYDTLPGLIVPYLAFALPLATYILVSFFKSIPADLEEAALTDGASRFQAFRLVIIPLAAPGLVTAGLLTFIAAWNEFLLAISLTSSPSARTVPAGLAYFTGSVQFEQPLGAICAASVIVSIPLVTLVLIFQRRIVAGLTAGAVKG